MLGAAAMDPKICIAPTPELIRYLAILRRALTVITSYCKSRYRPGVRFAGVLADALHNLPAFLLHYDTPFIGGAYPMEIWLGRAFPDEVADMKLPEHVRTAYERIFSSEGVSAELGLRASGGNLDLAPVEKMQHYLTMIGDVFIWMRITFQYDKALSLEQFNSQGSEMSPGEQLCEDGVLFTGMLRDIPTAMVRWNQFDESEYWKSALESAKSAPAEVDRRWRAHVTSMKPAWPLASRPPAQSKKLQPSDGRSPKPESKPPAAAVRAARKPVAPAPVDSLTRPNAAAARSVPDRDYQWVTEQIALGSAVYLPEHIPPLLKDGITHVLDCRPGRGSAALYDGTSISYRQNGVLDDGKPKPDEWFFAGIDFAVSALRNPRNRLLVHCKFGMSRSPTMVYAILRVLCMSGEQAKQCISKARTVARVTYPDDANRAAEKWGSPHQIGRRR